MVAKSYAYNIDYEKAFNPIAKMTIMKQSLIMVATIRWSLYHMDVKKIVVHGNLYEKMHMEQPPNYVNYAKHILIWFIGSRNLTWLKQTPKAWSNKIS